MPTSHHSSRWLLSQGELTGILLLLLLLLTL
jgi:hypothetical protein